MTTERTPNDPFPRPLTLDEVARIFAGDLPLLTEAQLAQTLCEIQRSGTSSLARTLEPLARAELARRWSAGTTITTPAED